MTIFWVLLTIAGLLLLFYFVKRSSTSRQDNRRNSFEEISVGQAVPTKPPDRNPAPVPPISVPIPSALKNEVKEKIDIYLKKYEQDRKENDLHNFLYPQFDLHSKIVAHEITTDPIASLAEIEIDVKDEEVGLAYLIEKVQNLTGSKKQIAWPEALRFLFDLAKINARIQGLKSIEYEITDYDRFNNYMSKAENKKNELFKRYR